MGVTVMQTISPWGLIKYYLILSVKTRHLQKILKMGTIIIPVYFDNKVLELMTYTVSNILTLV